MIAKKTISRLFSFLFVIVFMLAAMPPQAVGAITSTVSNCSDSDDGSLRQIIDDASDDDIINFGLNCPIGSPITLVSVIAIDKNLTISGAGHEVVISGNNNTRIFNISWDTTVTLEDLTLKNGAAPADESGGAIYDNGSFLAISHVTFDNNHVTGNTTRGGAIYHGLNGTLTISNSTFNGNSAGNYGGAIESQVATTITDSTFTNNTAFRGGAFNSFATITLSLERVTMNGNTAIGPGPSAGQGGAIYFGFGTLTINNSTLSGNGSASYTTFGGAIYTYNSTVTIKNSTIVNNIIDTSDPGFAGGGIEIDNANLSYFNTILANNVRDDCYTGGGLTVAQNINNLVEVSVGCGTPTLSADPVLGALTNNGGSTQTHALLAGSPAINAGTNTGCPTNDQRGVARQGGVCDIGAYEYNYTGIYYVKQPATGTANCQSWDNACTLQTALTTAISGDEIWVKAGTHKPTTGSDRAATFQLKNGVAVYGGFAGTESARGQRNLATNVTILSGDLNGNDNSVMNIDEPTRADNSYHVVTGATGATLDGFTITAGNASINPFPLYAGGGMLNISGSSPTLVNLTFTRNTAAWGGGIFNQDSSNPTLTDVTFSGNWVSMDGAGMCNYSNSHPILTNVTFSGNSAPGGWGGGMYNNTTSNPTLTNVTFSGNSASRGGGMRNSNSSPILTNVTFSGNSANTTGGGMENMNGGSPQIRNTIFWGNTAGTAGAQIYDTGTPLPTPDVRDSVVQGGYAGGTNIIITDPLLGTLGNYGGFTQTIPLPQGSSAIDALVTGTNGCGTTITTDQRGVTRPQGPKCDIGAFEYKDTTAPTVNTFTVTTPSNSLTIPITAFSATDNMAVTGYLVTDSATVPAAGAGGWTPTAPTTYTVVSDGSYTLYPWAKDATGNVSAAFGSPRTVLVDTTKPVVNIFTITTPSNSLNIPITAFTATDTGGLAGYMITTSATAPAASATGWTVTAPTTYTVASDGTYTLYPWAKDVIGNVSAVSALQRTVVVDTIFRIYLPLIMR